MSASQATGLGSAEAPEPSGLGPTGAIPSAAKKKKRWHNPNQFFIVFSPEGPTPPVVVHPTHAAALYSAYAMARKHPGKTFFVMGSASRPCVIDPDSLTGCADDQTWADVPVEALREAVEENVAGEPA